MHIDHKIKVGIGFATGRKSFQKVLRSYIRNWEESGLAENGNISLNLFVAYDLTYNQTLKKDYVDIHEDLKKSIDNIVFIGRSDLEREGRELADKGIIDDREAQMIFRKGYAAQRNGLLYSAVKSGMDFLIFLDDDEYPVAVTKTREYAVWGGQHVITSHIRHIARADITHGYHCGYISPIPYVEYNHVMPENVFRTFIEAISNDILNWDNVSMQNGGVTYADTKILIGDEVREVEEINHAKFISGANLGLNLTDPRRIFPFYNPVGARGEDTFLSTCLTDRKVVRIPCYTFHDGFSTYHHLLEGVLPIRLKFIQADSEKIIRRFYKACLGWIRYKPLLMYITEPGSYEKKIAEMRRKLGEVLPAIAAYFDCPDFANILPELEKYNKNVKKHYHEFMETKRVWARMMEYFAENR